MWWSNVVVRKPATPETDGENVVKEGRNLTTPATETYMNILKILFFQMYAQKDCVTHADWIRHTDETTEAVASPNNILFWSSIQKEILLDGNMKKVAFVSDMGTGKTTLLIEKARVLLKLNQKVFFVTIIDSDENELTAMLRQKLKHRKWKVELCNFASGVYYLLKDHS
jgi:hypothetical protein